MSNINIYVTVFHPPPKCPFISGALKQSEVKVCGCAKVSNKIKGVNQIDTGEMGKEEREKIYDVTLSIRKEKFCQENVFTF